MRQIEISDSYTIQVEPADDILPENIGIPSLPASTFAQVDDEQLQCRQLPKAVTRSTHTTGTLSPKAVIIPERQKSDSIAWNLKQPVITPDAISSEEKSELSIFLFLLALIVLGVLGGISFSYLISIAQSMSTPVSSTTVGHLIASHVYFLSGGH